MIEYIEKLLNGRPVEWKKIEDISKNICSGGTPRSYVPEYYGGDIPWLRTQEVNFSEIWDTEVKITKEGLDSSNAKYIPANCIIIAMYGATVGRVGINKIPLTTNQACANIEVNEDIVYYRYLFYYLSSQYEYIKSLGTGTQTNINAGIVKKLLIPIPPLEVQEEVVRILDKFTLLEAELEERLESELECRRKQYGFYRDKLLSEEYLLTRGKVEWKTLGEVAEFYNGLTGKNTHDFETGNARYVPYKNIFDNIEINECLLDCVTIGANEKQNSIQYGDILFTGSSETPDEVGMSCAVTKHFAEPIYLNSFSFGIRFHQDIQIIPEFAKYIFRCTFVRKQIIMTANGVTRFNVSKVKFRRIIIPIPPLSVQREIVRILDRFDVLTNSISEGLPREIELRRKQYEYYREKLLNFPH